MTRFQKPVLYVVIALCLVAAFVSYMLMIKHFGNKAGWFDSVCQLGGDGEIGGCDSVLNSAYGTWKVPFVQSSDPTRVPTKPVSLLGLMYFSVLATWFIAVGRPAPDRRWWHAFPTVLVLGGVCGSLFFIYVMFSKLQTWCPWCVVVQVCNIFITAGTLLLWPHKPKRKRRPEAAPTSAGATPVGVVNAGDASAVAPGHPGLRLALVTICAGIAISIAEWHFQGLAANYRAYQQLEKILAEVQQDTMKLLSMYQNEPKREITLREDDPAVEGKSPRLVLVEFSDFQCPHCKDFADYLHKTLIPLFDGHLHVVFKHFPGSNQCNKLVGGNPHPFACPAAAAAEAARILGGNEAFWKAHDLLFANQGRLGSTAFYRELATDLGFDAAEFEKTMGSDAIIERVTEDIALAGKIELNSTPAVYVSGRRVPRLAVKQGQFWSATKQYFEQAVKKIQAQENADAGEGDAATGSADTPKDATEGQAGSATTSPPQ